MIFHHGEHGEKARGKAFIFVPLFFPSVLSVSSVVNLLHG